MCGALPNEGNWVICRISMDQNDFYTSFLRQSWKPLRPGVPMFTDFLRFARRFETMEQAVLAARDCYRCGGGKVTLENYDVIKLSKLVKF